MEATGSRCSIVELVGANAESPVASQWTVELTRFRGRCSPFGERGVELVRSGRNPEELAQKFEPSAQAIRNWVRQVDRDDGRRHDGLTTDERDELRASVARTALCVKSARS